MVKGTDCYEVATTGNQREPIGYVWAPTLEDAYNLAVERYKREDLVCSRYDGVL